MLAAVNMLSGERWSYAIYLLHILIHQNNILPYVVMYDINCRCGSGPVPSSLLVAVKDVAVPLS